VNEFSQQSAESRVRHSRRSPSGMMVSRNPSATGSIGSTKNRSSRPPHDAPRSGRPPTLDAEQREQVFAQLQQPPTDPGYDHQAWAPTLLLHRVHEEDGVAYSEGHARKRLSAAELSSRTARPRTHEADPDNEAEFQQTVEKNGRS